MKSANAHVYKAERNQAFYASHRIDNSSYPEWGVVVLFYILLHYVDAVLASDKSLEARLRDPQNHWDRREAVSKCLLLDPFADSYGLLYNRSLQARYSEVLFDSKTFKKVRDRIYSPALLGVQSLLK